MRRLLPVALLLLLATHATATDPPLPNPFDLRFLDLTDDVFVAQRPDSNRSPVHGNSLIVITEHDVVVFDGGGAPRSARQIVAEIRRRTDRPVRLLVNSHAHLDHTGGNPVFRDAFPSLEIVAGPGNRDYMLGAFGDRYAYVREIAADPTERQTRGKEEIAELVERGDAVSLAGAEWRRRYFRGDIVLESEAYREVEIVPQTATLEGRLTLHRGDRRLVIAHLGYGKAPGDLVLHLPDRGIVASGDILTHPIPYGFSRSPVRWLETLRALKDLGAERYVPGHGDVLAGDEYLDRVITLVEALVAEVAAAIDRGLGRDEALAEVDLATARRAITAGDPELEYLFERWFRRPAVGRAWDELSAADD